MSVLLDSLAAAVYDQKDFTMCDITSFHGQGQTKYTFDLNKGSTCCVYFGGACFASYRLRVTLTVSVEKVLVINVEDNPDMLCSPVIRGGWFMQKLHKKKEEKMKAFLGDYINQFIQLNRDGMNNTPTRVIS